jgi:hypothetical protein
MKDETVASNGWLSYTSDKREYLCSKGHRQTGRYDATAHSPDGVAEAESGPMCRACYVLWLGQQFKTVEAEPLPGPALPGG